MKRKQQPQRSTASSAPRHHGTLTYHKPLIALTASEARLYLQDLKSRLAHKIQRERAYLDRRAARGTHTPTDEAYEADQVLEQEIMDLLEAMEQDLDTKGETDARV